MSSPTGLASSGGRSTCASRPIDGPRALALLDQERPDIVLTDLKMHQVGGMQILAHAREQDPDVVVIVITGHGTVESAVEAVRAGAFDYLVKPLPSNEVLSLTVARAAARRRLVDDNRRLREPLAARVGFDQVVGESPAMEAVFETVENAARSDANILIQGESGTGKELIARAIHAQSPRAAEVFVPLDCAALPDSLLESELFGHERGAFTSADRTKPGMIEVADRGTLFLDEIGELPLGRGLAVGQPANNSTQGVSSCARPRASLAPPFIPTTVHILVRGVGRDGAGPHLASLVSHDDHRHKESNEHLLGGPRSLHRRAAPHRRDGLGQGAR